MNAHAIFYSILLPGSASSYKKWHTALQKNKINYVFV